MDIARLRHLRDLFATYLADRIPWCRLARERDAARAEVAHQETRVNGALHHLNIAATGHEEALRKLERLRGIVRDFAEQDPVDSLKRRCRYCQRPRTKRGSVSHSSSCPWLKFRLSLKPEIP